MSKKKFLIFADGYGEVHFTSEDTKTIEEAVERASDWAGAHEHTVTIYQAVKLVKPERAPVKVTDL